MSVLGAVFCVVLFAALLHKVRLVKRTREVLAVSRDAARTMHNTAMSDMDKERDIQRRAVRLFQLLMILTAGTLLCLLAPIAVILVLDSVGLMSLDGVLRVLARWDFLLAGTVLGIATYVAIGKWSTKRS